MIGGKTYIRKKQKKKKKKQNKKKKKKTEYACGQFSVRYFKIHIWEIQTFTDKQKNTNYMHIL